MLQILSDKEVFQRFLSRQKKEYLAMYSSVIGGITLNPGLMLVPIDDHMVHRGDAVFEVIKYKQGYIYQIKAHLERLRSSAQRIGLQCPNLEYIKRIVKETIKATNTKEGVIHIYLSRGPGSFTVNPLEAEGPQLYVVITKWPHYPDYYFEKGVKVIISDIPVKPGFFAQVKSCNYLPNVLMKRQAILAGAEFAVSLDEKGNIAEGATESVAIVDKANCLQLPEIKRILPGITLKRVAVLGAKLQKEGIIKKVEFTQITVEDVYQAKEMLLFGTTIDVLPVVIVNDKPIGQGEPGPIFKSLKRLFEEDIFSPEVSEPIYE